ncbi:hypothetical protein GEM23_19875 [Salmonella enterica]|nr:hypothetical protein [Salmonella enterica]ECG3461623.1 hypothetical protein [Salmonella enterica subsp. enterica serovar Mississippi]EDJ9088427.1 hypothetical protein [Salmonella enterica subsp. enterica serovar Vitkin]EJV7031052.1 hypothetical protein [Salmonella enterica subsp. enterica]ECC7861977.1 hypothetical protein [Salmonella enterica]
MELAYVVLPAVQVCLIPARRDAPRRVVKIIRHSLSAVPLFQQFVLAAVRIFPVNKRLRHHAALQKLREQLYQAKQVVKGNKDVLV